MRQVILLGTPGTKRTVYLEKAARSLNVPIKLLDWKEGDWRQLLAHRQTGGPGEMLLKIDPPVWDSCCLEDLDRLARSYEKDLKRLSFSTTLWTWRGCWTRDSARETWRGQGFL